LASRMFLTTATRKVISFIIDDIQYRYLLPILK
jgi:hypothetical protein